MPFDGDKIALDNASVRTTDKNGHLHVASSVITAAQVNDYRAEEIPGWQELGLTAGRMYALLRDPVELEKSVATLHGKPLLMRHRVQVADDHDKDVTIGAVANPVWEFPNIKAELTVWPGDAIAAIETGELKDLSAGYHYTPVMTPGDFNGVRYDGRMTEIGFNHVTICPQGRVVGAFVGDSAPQEPQPMPKIALTKKAAVAKGALLAYLAPKMAMDAKIDLNPILAKIGAANFAAAKPGIVAAVTKAAAGKLVAGATLDGLSVALDAAEKDDTAEDDPNAGVPMGGKKASDEAREFLKGKLSEDDMEAYDAMCGAKDSEKDDDEDDDDKKKTAKDKVAKDKAKDADPDKSEEKEEKVTKGAMDAAISAAVATATKAAHDAAVATQRGIREAEEAVRQYVGKTTMAHDSADGVYRAALTSLGVKVEGVHPSALPVILSNMPVPGARPKVDRGVAMDSSGAASFAALFPNAAPVRTL